MKYPDIFDVILMEADKKNLDLTAEDDTNDEDPSVDYTDDVNVVDDEAEDPGDDTPTDDNEGNDEIENQQEEQEGKDPEGDDPEEGEGTDYTDAVDDENADGEGDGEEGTEDAPDDSTDPDSQDDAGIEQQDDNDEDNKGKRFSLLKDYMSLYSTVKNGISVVRNIDSIDINRMETIKQVTNNLGVIKDYMYRYIMYDFDKNDYIDNLTQYNYFAQALSLNVNMLKASSKFEMDV